MSNQENKATSKQANNSVDKAPEVKLEKWQEKALKAAKGSHVSPNGNVISRKVK